MKLRQPRAHPEIERHAGVEIPRQCFEELHHLGPGDLGACTIGLEALER